jgi:hypothetical protein
MMSKLPQLVVAGIITPAQCNAILAVLRAMLAQLQSGSAASPSGQAVPPGLRDAIQRSPDLLNFLAGWLTDEQLEELMDDEELGNGS